ncbi:hypothetical protein [Streptomyces sp. NPDC053560]|uniref:hypothetical protein n=1 Tax=Streptomyces sp. NPDC053560 TaxID=3365711 RepID=UPI0037D990E4
MAEHTLNLTNTSKKTGKKAKEPSGVPLDWAATHGPITGALSATTGAGAVALLGAASHMPPGWPLAIGAAGAIGHGIGHSIYRRLTGRSIVTRAASWLLAGGWTTWAMTTGPLSWAAGGTLAALGVGIGAMASNAAIHEEAAEEERLSAAAKAATAEMDNRRREIAAEWNERIKRVCGVEVAIFAVEFWKTGTGFSLAAELASGGATWDKVAAGARGLATDARLPLGCAINVEEGDVQGRVVLDIPTENVIDRDYSYPTDYTALSILTGIPWGLLAHGENVQVFLREACALVLGPPGSGKSTFLDVVLAGFARCTDVVTWVIDLKAGACGRPWVRPWLEAQGYKAPKAGAVRPPEDTRPGVDWLASTPKEALRMLQAALAVNAARQAEYQDLLDERDTTLLPVSPGLPQIEIVVDEGAELLSAANFRDPTMKQVQQAVKKLMRTTRAMALRLVLTAVDGNVSAIGDTEVRKFSPVGVALTSGEGAGNNAGKLFGRVKIDASQLNAKGAGVIGASGANGFAPTGFKGWKTAPSMAREVTLATNARRPVLDEVSARAAGEDYARRWDADRAGWLWNDTNPTAPAAGSPEARATSTRTGERPGGLNLRYTRRGDDADALTAKLMKAIDETYGTTDEPDRRRSERSGGLNLRYNRQAEPAEVPAESEEPTEAQRAALQLLVAAGPEGTGASALERELKPEFGTSRQTIVQWLKAWAESGEVVKVGEATKARYVHHTHAPKGDFDN